LLINNGDEDVKAIIEKSLKEINYHVRWSSEWVIRLGDGTAESHEKMNTALESLWSYTGEFFEEKILPQIDHKEIRSDWNNKVAAIFEEATLKMPGNTWMQTGGTTGKHTEHMGFLLTELQYMQRTFPNVNW
jgi:ring-1,2-phenylacetyl-CoA epoxidase subunit PaaC